MQLGRDVMRPAFTIVSTAVVFTVLVGFSPLAARSNPANIILMDARKSAGAQPIPNLRLRS
jgi:hypothetical protein